jgi:fission process protein 1
VVTKILVRTAYGISWAYVAGDVGYEGYKDYRDDKDKTEIARTVIKRGLFQSVASMALPAFAIHTQVAAFTKVFNRGNYQIISKK